MLNTLLTNRVFMGLLGCLVLLGLGCLLYLTSLDREGQQVSDPGDPPVNSSEARTPETTEEPEGTAPPAPPNEKAQQGGHWHGDVWHAEPHTEPAPTPKQQIQPAIPVSDDVIYPHHELLKTNPVEALRQQAIERGHWSAESIPHFPPEDTEAAAIARNVYLISYYESIGDTTNNPILEKAARNHSAWTLARNAKWTELSDRFAAIPYQEIPYSEEYKRWKSEYDRMRPLTKLGWPRISEKYGAAILQINGHSSDFPKPE